MIDIPIKLHRDQPIDGEIIGVMSDDAGALIVRFGNNGKSDEEIRKIFGNVKYKTLTSSSENGVEYFHKIAIRSWSLEV